MTDLAAIKAHRIAAMRGLMDFLMRRGKNPQRALLRLHFVDYAMRKRSEDPANAKTFADFLGLSESRVSEALTDIERVLDELESPYQRNQRTPVNTNYQQSKNKMP